MTEAVQTLKRQRVRMILVNLAYFMVLLLLGVLLFLQNDAAGVTGYLLSPPAWRDISCWCGP